MDDKRDDKNVVRENEQARNQMPGRKIDPRAWRQFKNSADWQSAPYIFDPFYQREQGRRRVAETEEDEAIRDGETKRTQTGPGGRSGEDGVSIAVSRANYFGIRMTSEQPVFADELDKSVLISAMAGESARYRYDIVDFVLMDDDLRMVLRRGNDIPSDTEGDEDLLSDLTRSIRRRYLTLLPQKRQGNGQDLERANVAVIGNCAQALEECCRIHYLPVERGFVGRLADMKSHFFSGYVTIHGNFYWNCMRPDGFLMDLAATPGEALRRYEKAHREHMARLRG